ncbi:MAG: hypothetical protein AAF182_01100 [Pseudomonadota bacterium]
MAARLYSGLIHMASDLDRGTDAMKLIQHIAGVLVETYMVFDDPDIAMTSSLDQLAQLLDCEPLDGIITRNALPPAYVIDHETERGRMAARMFFEEWLDCEYEFHGLVLVIIHNIFVSWEEEGLQRAEAFRLLVECTKRCLAYEISPQELCDIVIETKIAQQGWTLADCIASLSAVAGRCAALSVSAKGQKFINKSDLPENLDHVVYVMTQEAIRLGVPSGSNWRLGLAANDTPLNPPVNLILGMEPSIAEFFEVIKLNDKSAQSVACAKAAGRMIAVAAGGEVPEMEPAIAKPLAMAAITETYKSVCLEYNSVSV